VTAGASRKKAGFRALKRPDSIDPGEPKIVVYTLVWWGGDSYRRPQHMSSEVSTGGPLRGIASGMLGRPMAIDRTGLKLTPGRAADPAATRPSDRVELSDRARFLAKLKEEMPVRQGLIDTLRAQIESGEYDTPEKFEAALDGLIEDLDLTP
jgi:hypothetical protein